MMHYAFQLALKVRDYECDMQGIVNNSVYQNYLEHARHEFLLSRGIRFAELTQRGIHLVVTKATLEYKASLKSGDDFSVCLQLRRSSKVRGEFIQNIYRQHDNALVLRGVVEWTTLNEKGRPFCPPELGPLFVT